MPSATQILTPVISFIRSIFPAQIDSPLDTNQKMLLLQGGGCGTVELLATQKFRDPIAYPIGVNPQLISTVALFSQDAFTLSALVFTAGKEIRDHTGAVKTTITLEGGVMHFVSLTSFTVSAATAPLRATLAEPWQALVAG